MIVAVATTKTAAVRIPAKRSGSASGSLDPPQHLVRRHPHPASRLDGVPVDLVDGDVGVGQDRRHREHDQREHDGGWPIPRKMKPIMMTRVGSARPTLARFTATNEAAVEMPEGNAERHGDRDRDEQCDAGEDDVLPRLLEDQLALVDDELEAVDEDVQRGDDHATFLEEAQGVIAR